MKRVRYKLRSTFRGWVGAVVVDLSLAVLEEGVALETSHAVIADGSRRLQTVDRRRCERLLIQRCDFRLDLWLELLS